MFSFAAYTCYIYYCWPFQHKLTFFLFFFPFSNYDGRQKKLHINRFGVITLPQKLFTVVTGRYLSNFLFKLKHCSLANNTGVIIYGATFNPPNQTML